MNKLLNYTFAEEVANVITHGLAFLASLLVFFYFIDIIPLEYSYGQKTAIIIYSLTLMLMFLSSTGALNLSEVPGELIIIGAGYIGLELGSVWSRLGSKVTVIEFADRILPGMDSEVSKNFQKILIKQGFDFKLSTALRSITKKSGKTYVTVETKGQSIELVCDKVLISTGRKAYTYGLNLDQINIETDSHGKIETNDLFQTKIKNIYVLNFSSRIII